MWPRAAIVLLLLLGPVFSAPAAGAGCANPFVDRTPLDDLGTGTYEGYEGGLYPGGTNARPASHDRDFDRTSRLLLLDAEGNPDPVDGKVVLVSIGNSSATLEFDTFQKNANRERGSNAGRVLVDCAEANQTADVIADPQAPYWGNVDAKLAGAGVTPLQVQSAWFKNAIPYPDEGFPGHAMIFRDDLRAIMRNLKARYPNLKSVYLSSRIYGGWAPPLGTNPEPYAYEYGFSVKWLIEEQLSGSPDLNFDPAKGPVVAPWLSWGPYLWADGIHPRSDGLTWQCEDFQGDRIHPSPLGVVKVSERLLDFFKTDPTTVPWFLDCSVADLTAFAFPPEVLEQRMRNLAVGALEIAWDSLDAVAGIGVTYSVLRGDLSELRDDRGFARTACHVPAWADTPHVDSSADPAPGAGYYYLVRGRNSCGIGTWGDSSLVPDPRDALDAGTPACF